MAHSTRIEEEFPELSRRTNKFAIDLYLALESSTENVVVSPVSLQILLAMLLPGTRGTTASEIANVLHQPQNDEKLLDNYQAMIKGFRNEFLKLATNIFVEETFEIHPEFKKNTKNYFLAEARPTNFKRNPSGSRKEINDWAAENTNNKINNLLSEDSVTEKTVLILANAIHFKANWNTKFDETLTFDSPFYVTATNTTNVKMMCLSKANLGYRDSEQLNAQLVQLPYVGNEFSMIIVLPNEKDGLHDVESKLALLDFSDQLSYIWKTKVNLQLPKFKIEKAMDLNEILARMGMPTAFTEKADLSGISEEPLVISKVVQKAFIEVNEEGTEAAAATGMIMMMRSALLCPEVICDHPFLYLVLKNREILFLGKVHDPSDIVD